MCLLGDENLYTSLVPSLRCVKGSEMEPWLALVHLLPSPRGRMSPKRCRPGQNLGCALRVGPSLSASALTEFSATRLTVLPS